ncbi:sulfotransferase [Mesorhizobium sp. J8]|uniref:sulfotransferase n=1 Tax=Mesorhizobium sp. J8 TaxID=2777475 RepID=UPI0019151748|nr:sulfotransferase [Mesorhizobium sp. J8]BCM17558.1 nodulation protein NodH [Mesorhizobium sp. J8]
MTDRHMPPPAPFVILAMPRTGTHYLEELLNEHPNVLSNGELLNAYDTNWPDKHRLLCSDRELLELAYLRHPTRSDKKVTHVGCKVNEPQFHDRPGFFAELTRWPRLKVILVVRENTLESLRSLIQARQTRQWLKFSSDNDAPPPQVRLSIADCEAYFKTADDFHAQVAHSFAKANVLEIEYESLLREPATCLATIWDFLGVPAFRVRGAAVLQRQETRPLEHTIENFHELRRHFAHGPYARFFEVGEGKRAVDDRLATESPAPAASAPCLR